MGLFEGVNEAAGLKPIDLFEGEKDDYPRTREWALWIWQNMPDAQAGCPNGTTSAR